MAYNKSTILSTREEARGGRVLAQVFAVLGGRLDKISLYLEPVIAGSADSMMATVAIYDVDSYNLPTGIALYSTSMLVSEIKIRRFYNFAVTTATPTKVAVTLSVSGGDIDNFVGWRYVQASSTGEPLLTSEDGGASWVIDTSRKFAYIAYSQIPDVVTFESASPSLTQTAKIQAGKQVPIVDDSINDFGDPELERATIDGTSIVISFGDFIVSMVVDMSGSMTWNDHNGLRLQFLSDYIDDMESILPSSSQVLYSITKFNSRKIGRMRLLLQSNTSTGGTITGVRVVRKLGPLPVTGPIDGIVIFEGLAEEVLDTNLITDAQYQYGIFVFDTAGNFSEIKTSWSIPVISPVPPLGVAGFKAEEQVVLNGDFDIGKRNIKITWSHPQLDDSSVGYDKIFLVRRNDRPPENPMDGTVIFSGITDSNSLWDNPYYDFDTPFTPVGSPKDHADYPVAGLTYYYAIFTENSIGVRCLLPNAGKSNVKISEADRFWEKAEPPFDDPITYGFDITPPSSPTGLTTTIGDGELEFSWIAGSSSTRRYVIYYNPDSYPKGIDVDGRQTYSGDVVYDGSNTSFIHRELDNGQPHFYTIVALDSVANRSTGVQFSAKPIGGQTDIISPSSVSYFEAEPKNKTTNRLSWGLPISDANSIEGWFGDSILAICNVTFADAEPRTTSATLELVEERRTSTTILPDNSLLAITETPSTRIVPGTASIVIGDAGAATTVDITDAIVPTVAMRFGSSTEKDATTTSGTFEASPLVSIQASMEDVSIRFYGLLSVKEASTGKLITGVKTASADVTLRNPFKISITNEPASFIHRPSWDPTCNNETAPKKDFQILPGIYAGMGDGFPLVITASFRDLTLEENITLTLRVLNKETGDLSVIKLPNANSNGETALSTNQETDEILDRTGQPTGETKTVTRVFIELPPQSAPGDYTVEVTGNYLGFTRVSSFDVHYEPSLNIDLDLKPFSPDGIDITEQGAFVYFGDPLGNNKIPVGDLTITEWAISALDSVSKKNLRKRPFYSRDNVPGTGVKAYTRGGTAKNVFFGPGIDIGPETSEEETAQESSSCAPGSEIYEISVTAKVGGFSRTEFGAIRLNPSPQAGPELNRIFLRKVDNFNKDTIYADGIIESTWEVLALPENDGIISDKDSGAYFRDKITSIGGSVPQLIDGKIVTLTTKLHHGFAEDAKVYVRTNLTGTQGRPWYAKAVVEDGRALFHLRLNTRVSGSILRPPGFGSEKPGTNIVYGDSTFVGWDSSALIFSLSTYTSIEVGGKPVAFYGGGSSLEFHTPPCFLSFKEPLGLGVKET